MKKIGNLVSNHKSLILIITMLLLIPTIIGIKLTKINYDILVYLPQDIETIKGQEILTDDFEMGAFSVSIIENMNSKDIIKLENKIRDIKNVNKVMTINDVTGTSFPVSMLPNEVTKKVTKDDQTLMLITFKTSTSDEETLNSVDEIRKITDGYAKVGGMSAMALDTMELSNKEIAIYVVIAVVLCMLVLMVSLDSYFVPVLLLSNIGIAILFNMGSNVLLGNISYITKAISAVLQLGVTTDFSIFLYHKYEKAKENCKDKKEAMANAINETLVSVFGSSFTTIAGFLALCTMSLTLGKDIGIVMAKGVLLGVICVITVFPALLLFFDKLVDKTKHKVILLEFKGLKEFIIKHYKLIFILFLILLLPAYYGNKNVSVYYNLDKTLPNNLSSSIANSTLKEKFDIVSPEIILLNKNIKNNDINDMCEKLEKIDGISMVLSPSKISDIGLPESMIPDDVLQVFENDRYKMIFINSTYDIATDELNNQIEEVSDIVKKYDKNALISGEGPLMKDLVLISNHDFNSVNYTSLLVIFIIMIFVLKSITLPVLLICAIEFAICVNMSFAYYGGITIPFIASIVIGTIQLGATIDYAILMTTRYLDERKSGKDKMDAINIALDNSISSIIVSGMCFFAATFGVGVYSKLELIGSLCTLISRGAIISMIVVIFILPSMLIIFDKLITKTSFGFRRNK